MGSPHTARKLSRICGPAFGAGGWGRVGPGRGRGGARTGLSLGPCGRPCLRAAQPRDSFASWNTGACAPHSRRGGRGAGGFLAAAVGTETVEVPSSALLAQIAAHVFESHPSSGQLGWVGALELAEEGDNAEREGARLVSGLTWASQGLSLPPCLRPCLASAPSCPFLSPSHLLGGAVRGFFS